MSAFRNIRLVDAYRVYPDNSFLGTMPQPLEGSVKVVCDWQVEGTVETYSPPFRVDPPSI